jgi:cobyrinic acid a,c-diamide synthase
VRVFKCGPDFLDPHWHQLASGAPVHQLDLWMTGEADCAQRLHAAREADLILIEGVMGLFDGDPSAADLAQHFGVPVLAVVDASAMAGTFGALAFGLQHYRPGLPWAGVLANRVGSARHADMLRMACATRRLDGRADAGEPWRCGPARARGLAARAPPGPGGRARAGPTAWQRLDAAADALAATPLGQMTA